MFDFFNVIMNPLYYAISFVLMGWHTLWDKVGLDPAGGAAWALSIIGLTLIIRAALIPLFVKQIKASRNMQLIQPKVKELQKKHGHDREKLAQETMKLYRESGTNPFASCLPILLQMPIFFALFGVLNNAADLKAKGVLTKTDARNFGQSELFDVPLSGTLFSAGGQVDIIVLAALLVLAMTATTFLTQRQLMSKNMPPDALTGPYAQQQKFLLYILPVVFAVGGIAFPIGVLLYWTTSNLWTMGQQFYVIRRNPAPGTPAFAAKQQRDAAKAAKHGVVADPASDGAPGTTATATEPETDRRPPQRQQPKRQSRQQRKKSGGATGSGGTPPEPSGSS